MSERLTDDNVHHVIELLDKADRWAFQDQTLSLAKELLVLRARVARLEAALVRCKTVLGNMALENEGAVFNRWPISHEPLRADARNLLPVIDAALKDAPQ